MKEEISEGKLRAVSCLKGGLVEEMEDQNSLILEQSGTVASLNIQLEEMAIKKIAPIMGIYKKGAREALQ